VPPALPATLTIGTTFAIDRLRKSGIFCISPNRVNIGGKVNVICFDKTGTLTEDGLDVLGVRTIDRHEGRFSELQGDITEVPITGGSSGRTPLLYALATCHQLKLIDGEVIGDPLDIKMFEFTGWTLDEGHSRSVGKAGANGERPTALVQTVVRPPGSDKFKLEDAMKAGGGKHAHFLELGVIRQFDFVSAIRRMSVIVKRLKSTAWRFTSRAHLKSCPISVTPRAVSHISALADTANTADMQSPLITMTCFLTILVMASA
jgi:cation-transporting ATPase 13A3/4/5